MYGGHSINKVSIAWQVFGSIFYNYTFFEDINSDGSFHILEDY